MRNKVIRVVILFFIIVGLSLIYENQYTMTTVQAAQKNTYTISPSSKPFDPIILRYSTYNKDTKDYYLIRSYLELFEKKKGGTLIFKKGTYTISNALYVPSNVTLQFEDGVKIIKGTKTGTYVFQPSTSIFQLIRPSKAHSTGVYDKYKGEKNIKFIGKGNVTFDMKNHERGIAIIMGHNQNVTVEGIQFKNMYNAHFIEMDASKNVTIKNSSFKNAKDNASSIKEAINLDTPDRTTNGWSQQWSKFDAYPNTNVLIEKNEFSNMPRAIGTHKYSYKKLHNQVVIRSNIFYNLRKDPIRAMNWSNTLIEKNTFKMSKKHAETFNANGIIANGTINPTIRNNTFDYFNTAVSFTPHVNNGAGTNEWIYCEVTEQNKKDLLTNTLQNMLSEIIYIKNNIQPDGTRKTERVYFPESVLRKTI